MTFYVSKNYGIVHWIYDYKSFFCAFLWPFIDLLAPFLGVMMGGVPILFFNRNFFLSNSYPVATVTASYPLWVPWFSFKIRLQNR